MKNILIAACLCLGASLGAATFSVTNLSDSGAGSLRQAVIDAEAAAGADNIIFNATLNGTISLLTALPDINESVTMEGPTAPNSAVTVARSATAATNFRILTITAGTVSISDLTIAEGNITGAPAQGGGIRNTGALSLTRCVVRDCVATGDNGDPGQAAQGGGIYSAGTTTLTDCMIMDCEVHGGSFVVSGNGGPARGGGIFMDTGALTMIRCLVEHCHSDGGQGITFNTLGDSAGLRVGPGGANVRDSDFHGNENRAFHAPSNQQTVVVNGPATFLRCSICESVGGGMDILAATTLRNCTISGNMAGGAFGGIEISSSGVSLEYCTITANDGTVGGIFVLSGTPSVEGCIIADNTGAEPDVSGDFTDGGFNLIGDGDGATGFTTSTLVGSSFSPISAGLGPRKSFGDTQGHEPQFGSFAINNGGAGAPFDDQRGANRALGGVADIGAIEFLVNNAPSFSGGPAVNVDGDGSFTIAAWATNIHAGASFETGQALTFLVVGPTYLFRSGPSIDPLTGDLTFDVRGDSSGHFVFDVYLVDDGGTAGGGSDTSPAAVLVIAVNNDDEDDDDDLCSTGGKGTPWLPLFALVSALLVAVRLKRTRA